MSRYTIEEARARCDEALGPAGETMTFDEKSQRLRDMLDAWGNDFIKDASDIEIPGGATGGVAAQFRSEERSKVCAYLRSRGNEVDAVDIESMRHWRDKSSVSGLAWQRVHYSLSSGQSTCGVDLRVTLSRPLTESDKRVIGNAMQNLERDLLAESARLHPDNVEWKRTWLRVAREMFDAAGLAPIYVREIDNEYCGPKCCPHRVWLLVTTRLGVIKVGWRKNVIVIDWSASDVVVVAEDLFATEDVTKDDRMIHAWGYEKATEYLGRIAAAGAKCIREQP